MGYFDTTVAEYVAGRVVRSARLIELDFADAVGRFWEGGTGTLAAGGRTWAGTGELGSVSGIESAIGGTAPQVTLGLSGIDPQFISEMIAAEINVKGRDATIFIQFFDDNWAPLDQPYAVFLGLMDVMSAKVKSPTEASIELTVESVFTRRGRPPWGYLSDRAQKQFYPDDNGLDQMSSMRLAAPFWPVF